MSDKLNEVKDLMRPRCKVGIDFWRNPFEVGTILELRDNPKVWDSKRGVTILEEDLWEALNENKYPETFKPLQWFEERKIEEMPKYVRYGDYDKVHTVYKLIKKIDYPYSEVWKMECRDSEYTYPLNESVPASLTDYNNFLTLKKQV